MQLPWSAPVKTKVSSNAGSGGPRGLKRLPFAFIATVPATSVPGNPKIYSAVAKTRLALSVETADNCLQVNWTASTYKSQDVAKFYKARWEKQN